MRQNEKNKLKPPDFATGILFDAVDVFDVFFNSNLEKQMAPANDYHHKIEQKISNLPLAIYCIQT